MVYIILIMCKQKSFFLFITLICSVTLCDHALFAKQIEGGGGAAVWQTPLVGMELHDNYQIHIGDRLSLNVLNDSSLNSTRVMVSPDGRISFPLVGMVKASGLTVAELEALLKDKFSVYIREPELMVTLDTGGLSRVTVFGEVFYPDVFTYEGQITVLDAIELAGFCRPTAKVESVIIVSGNFTENVEVRRINLFLAVREGFTGGDYYLKPNDVVYVPKNFISDTVYYLGELSSWVGSAADIFMASGYTIIWDWKKDIRWWAQRIVGAKNWSHVRAYD